MNLRIFAAILYFVVALAVLLTRYAPPHTQSLEPGDPAVSAGLAGFAPPEHTGDMVARRVASTARVSLPPLDARGAQMLALRLNALEAASIPLRYGNTALVVPGETTFRTYHLLVPPDAPRQLALTLVPPDEIVVERVALTGRAGWPPLLDLIGLIVIALAPVLLQFLTMRLPLDWALLPGTCVVLGVALVPSADWLNVLRFGPSATAMIGAAALLPLARAYPGAALVTLIGAGLRCYGLGWGGGYIFHPDEQALADRTASGLFPQVCYAVAWSAARLSGNTAWLAPWSVVLIGRALAALASVALIPVAYALGRCLLRPRWALLAAIFVAVAPILVQQSHFATPAPLEALLVTALLLACTRVALRPSAVTAGIGVGLGGALLIVAPHVIVVAALLIVAQWGVRSARPRLALGAALLVAGLVMLRDVIVPFVALVLPASALAGTGARQSGMMSSAAPPHGYVLFNMLLWGLGPLLLQLGVVGWGVGLMRSLQQRRERVWLPLLCGIAGYVAAVGGAATIEIRHVLPLAPLLCLTAALLLQLFAQRLRYRFGQRAVRILATTALSLALLTSLGLLNIYRKPDPRIAASRWLLATVQPSQRIVHDYSVTTRLPLSQAMDAEMLLNADNRADQSLFESRATALARADYLVLAVDPADVDLGRLARRDPAAACYYTALFDGQLGFVPRRTFGAQPHLGSWSLDDSRADLLLRMYDHPRIRVYERVSSATVESVTALLRCDPRQQ